MEYNPIASPGQEASTKEYARFYASLGWRVFPVWSVDTLGVCRCQKREACPSPGKHPRPPRGVHAATVDSKKLDSWKWSTANIGIATGSISGLVVIDIDGQKGWESYAELKGELGPLVESDRPLKVVTSKGGAHAYVAYPEGLTIPSRTGVAPNVDIRADGGYVVAPPSVHATGHRYAFGPWIDSLPKLSPSWAEYLARDRLTERQKILKETEVTEAVLSPVSLSDEMKNLIDKQLPTKTGTRNKQVFELARVIKGMPEYAGLDAIATLPFAQYWYDEGVRRGLIETPTFDDTMADWLTGWPKVKFPKGEGIIMQAIQLAHKQKPEAASRFESEGVRLLVGVCYHLQKAMGDEPFFISCRKAGEIAEVSHVQANRYLSTFVTLGFLKRVGIAEPGKGNPAQRYRWIGGD
jgi:bifunctional DNA primase/polymerase-like protein